MKKYIFILIGLISLFTGCTSEPDFNDAVYITGTMNSKNIRFLVDGESDLDLTVTSSTDVASNVEVEIAPDPSKLEAYNQSTGKNYQLPPDGAYEIGNQKITIEAGKTVSTPLDIKANSDKFESGVAYCLPVSIKNVRGGLGVLESSRTAYILFTKVIRTKVAELDGKGSFEVPTFAGEKSPVWALSQFTIEFKVKPARLSSSVAESSINPILGSHESFLARFGDGSSIPVNKLNFAKVAIGQPYHPDKKNHYEVTFDQTFENDHWYHVAVTYDGTKVRYYLDGVLQAEKTTSGGYLNLAMSYGGHGWDDTFAIGRSYGTHWRFKGCISEVRIWTLARSQSELQDGVCYVDPSSNGLLAYWRFNGEVQDDDTIRDLTGHGHNAHPKGSYQWVDNQKCPF